MNADNLNLKSFLLRGARVVLPSSVAEDTALLVEGGRIARVITASESQLLNADEVLDLNGHTLFPGFIDIHNHGAAGFDTLEATSDDLHHVARALAKYGVTAWLPTLVPAIVEDYARAAGAVTQLMNEQDARPPAAYTLGLHYEGPFVNTAQCGALRTTHFRIYSNASDLDALTKVGHENAAHMITIAPEIEGGIDLVRELTARKWVVSIGHTRANVATLDAAAAAGARHMTHFMNAMLPLNHRAPGPVGWGLVRDDVTCDVIADGVHSDQLILKLILRCKTAERIALISDSIAPTGLGDGEYHIWDEKIAVVNGRTQNERGAIAGSVVTMLDCVRMMLSLGASAHDVARMAASTPARLLGLDDSYGSIEEGKRADLVALDDEGRVRLAMIGGRVTFEASDVKNL